MNENYTPLGCAGQLGVAAVCTPPHVSGVDVVLTTLTPCLRWMGSLDGIRDVCRTT